ncbi:hypothetical protein COV93_07960 [Candidatus Woesearchaeota archaeon CG11_big_fil_rev_8_21_14_0_20_43_8]|nr:MAG: hypothetical protein COV93_07960 [Candidatus Woesearchaeota archaeon CG11_big_fil_rev_8_21_14_0_20_43_8]PIO05530.1 MAG: hypothetical protein COT47_04470 [Candidatus Woesearchaeota archaeon CG08_land_8_20_14_0_20_43_7]
MEEVKDIKKGIVFTLDSLLCIILAGAMLLACLFFLGETDTGINSRNNLAFFGMDALTVLEKTGMLRATIVSGDPSGIGSYLDGLPPQICASCVIYSPGHDVLISSRRSGCLSSNDTVHHIRTFIDTDSRIRYALMEVWIR